MYSDHSSAVLQRNGSTPQATPGLIWTVEDCAHRFGFKRVAGEWHGPNPSGQGATSDGFILNDDGTAFDRKQNQRYSSTQTAQAFGIEPGDFEPVASYRARNGHNLNGAHSNGHNSSAPAWPAAPRSQAQARPPAPTAQATPKAPKGKPVRELVRDYHDANGKVLFQTVRREYADGSKDFLQRQPNPSARGGFDYHLKGLEPVLYRLPQILKSHTVIVVEGEKCADRLNEEIERAARVGAVATTNAGGAPAKWLASYNESLRNKRVIFNPDNDLPGRNRAAKACPGIDECARTLELLELPDLPEKGDAFDFLEAGGTLDDFLDLANAAPTWANVKHIYQAPALIEGEAATTEPARSKRFEVLSLQDIFERPRLEWLVQDIFLERGTSVITADYGAFKSFNILDLGLCVATGKPWHGREVKPGAVVYVIAEGAYTTTDRARAWLIRYQMDAPANFHIIESPVQIANASECAAFIEEIRELNPALVIFDTLAKCNSGKDENDAKEMGLFTHGMETIARELDAQVTAVHHNNKAGSARGSNSLPSNVDTSITLERSPGLDVVKFKCDKQKGAPFETFSLIGRKVELPEFDEFGRPVTTLIFEPIDTPLDLPKADETRERVFEVLRRAPDGYTSKQWQIAVENQTGCKASRFFDHRKDLAESGRVRRDGFIYRACELSTPIPPLYSDYSESERVLYSDYSDDALASEQSEYSEVILPGMPIDAGQVGQVPTSSESSTLSKPDEPDKPDEETPGQNFPPDLATDAHQSTLSAAYPDDFEDGEDI